jgi:chitodextrinase
MERHKLTRYYRVSTKGHSASEVNALFMDLKRNPLVVQVYAEPKPVRLDGGEQQRRAGELPTGDAETPTDYTHQQHYKMSPVPVPPFKLDGLNSLELQRYAGDKCENVHIVSNESDHWSFEHLDLPKPFITYWDEPKHNVVSHDTSSAGIMFSLANCFDTEGFAPAAQAGYTKYGLGGLFDLGQKLKAGDAVQIGVQYIYGSMPASACDQAQCKMPVEEFESVFDEMSWLTEEKGVHLIIAAANGDVNLDDAYFAGRYDGNMRDSGSIFAGAFNSKSGERTWYSNRGSRVSLSSWEENVTTISYSAENPTSQYTEEFNGTSAANPIIAGAVAQLQGVANGIGPIPPKIMRTLLEPDPQRPVGVQPDLKRAAGKMFQEYGGALPLGQLASPDSVEAGSQFTLKAVLLNPDGRPVDCAWQIDGLEGASENEAEITLTAPAVDADSAFKVAVEIERSGQTARWEETVTVKASPGGTCDPTDPDAKLHPLWDADKTYIEGHTVQHNGAIWRASWYTRGTAPDKTDSFTLVSDLPSAWQDGKPYLQGDEVPHKGKHYRANYWVTQPPPAAAWSLPGDYACRAKAHH